MSGRKSGVTEEIHYLCLTKKATLGWDYDRIAEFLFKEHGITNSDDPTLPVHRSTILRWIRKGATSLEMRKEYRPDVERKIAGKLVDSIQEELCDIEPEIKLDDVDRRLKVVEMKLKLLQERSRMFGTYAPKRKEIAVTTQVGGVKPKDLNPKSEKAAADFDKWLEGESPGS